MRKMSLTVVWMGLRHRRWKAGKPVRDCCSIQARKEDNLKGARVVSVERREAW